MVFLLLPCLLYDCILQTTRVKNWILLSHKKKPLSFSKWFNIALLEIIGIHAFVFIPWALWKSCRPEELKAYSSLNKNLLEIKIKHFWNQEKQKQSLLIQSIFPQPTTDRKHLRGKRNFGKFQNAQLEFALCWNYLHTIYIV